MPGCGCGCVPALRNYGMGHSLLWARRRIFDHYADFFSLGDLLLGGLRYIYVKGGRKWADVNTCSNSVDDNAKNIAVKPDNIYGSKRKVFTSRYMK